MKPKSLLITSAILSALGIADSWYLAQHALTNTALSCGIDTAGLSGCNVVAQSSYSHFLGIPLGIYGLVFYSLICVISCVLLVRSWQLLRSILLLLGVVGILFSIYFISIQVFVIDAICIYCLGSAFISGGIFIASILESRSQFLQKQR